MLLGLARYGPGSMRAQILRGYSTISSRNKSPRTRIRLPWSGFRFRGQWNTKRLDRLHVPQRLRTPLLGPLDDIAAFSASLCSDRTTIFQAGELEYVPEGVAMKYWGRTRTPSTGFPSLTLNDRFHFPEGFRVSYPVLVPEFVAKGFVQEWGICESHSSAHG